MERNDKSHEIYKQKMHKMKGCMVEKQARLQISQADGGRKAAVKQQNF